MFGAAMVTLSVILISPYTPKCGESLYTDATLFQKEVYKCQYKHGVEQTYSEYITEINL